MRALFRGRNSRDLMVFAGIVALAVIVLVMHYRVAWAVKTQCKVVGNACTGPACLDNGIEIDCEDVNGEPTSYWSSQPSFMAAPACRDTQNDTECCPIDAPMQAWPQCGWLFRYETLNCGGDLTCAPDPLITPPCKTKTKCPEE